MGCARIAYTAIWGWMRIHSATSTSCRERVAVQCREACWVSWIERLPPWAHASCVEPLLSLCLTSANLKLVYKAWKSFTKARLCAAVLPCVYRGLAILNGLLVVCARELLSL